MKNVKWVICILFAGFFSGRIAIHGQVPSRDNFNFIFENNFEDDQLGRYAHSDFISDWNFGSSKTMPYNVIDIIKEDNVQYNKYMRAYFPKGTFGIKSQGTYWETSIPACTEIYFSYDIRFKSGFEWVLGGKIPGLCGGQINSGMKPGPTDGFSTRMMWSKNGTLVAYVYHQDQTNIYGNSYAWPNFAFTSGKWYNITIRIVLNSIGSNNGIFEGFIDGKLIYQKKNFKFRGIESVKLDKMVICEFFGGSTSDWSTTRDEWIDSDNFVAFNYSSKVTNVPRGQQASDPSKSLLHPYRTFQGGTPLPSLPTAPTLLTMTSISSNSVSMKWTDNCSNEQGFKIECRKDSESAYTQLAAVSTNNISYVHSGIQPGILYHYRVRAYNSAGNSTYSNILSVNTLSSLPVAPTLLTMTSSSSNSVSMKWTDNCSNELGFKIECRKDSESVYTQIATVTSNKITYIHSTLQSGILYHYRVRAYNSAGNSTYSNVLSVKTLSTGTGPVPIAHYVFENNPSDITGNGHNGTLVNGATYSSQSKEGAKSLLLDGINDNVNIGTFDLGNQFTFASWVYIPSISNIQTIIANTTSGSTSDGFKILVNSFNTSDRMIIVETGSGTATSKAKSLTSTFIFNSWNHIAVTVDKLSGKARIYHNGKDVTAYQYIRPEFSSNKNLKLGIMTNSTLPMKGQLDDTRIYNRILSATEIINLTTLPYLKSTDEVLTGVAITLDHQDGPNIFPNPFTDHFTIKSNEIISTVEIINISGVKVFQQEEIGLSEFIISNLPGKSVYMVKVMLNSGKIYTIKVLKK